jgi:signal transduction histidine kinase
MGYLEVMLDATMVPDRGQEILPIVMAEARKLNSMVGNLLTLSASNQGKLALQMESGDLGGMMRLYCEERRPLITSGLREFTWSIEPGLPPVSFDRTRLLQVVEALVENAIKFTAQGTILSVSVRPVPDGPATSVAIDVTDDGPGIAPYQLPHLFEAFQQGDGSPTRTVGGMGIGLSYSRKLIEAMGGRIEVRSELGSGTTFTIIFPVAPDRRAQR